MGESYGTNRAALLAESLSGSSRSEFSCVSLNGPVLLGNAIGLLDDVLKFDTVEDAVLMLPSMAATNRYHNKPGGSLEEFVQRAYDFCADEYITALFKGASLPAERREAVAEKNRLFHRAEERDRS